MFDNNITFLEPQVKQYGSHMVMSNVRKPINNKVVNIDTKYSNDAYKITTQYNFTLSEKINSVKSMYVKSVEIPNSFYNISSSLKNNTFIIKDLDNNIQMPVILKDKYYTISSLRDAINENLTQGLTFNFDENTLYSSFKNTSNSSFQLIFNTDEFGNIDRYNLRSKLGWILGFNEISVNINGIAHSNIAININTNRYLYLAIDDFSNNVKDNFIVSMNTHLMNKKVIAKILISEKYFPFGSTICETDSKNLISSTRIYKGETDIQKLNVELVNEWGLPVNLNGLDFSFTIILTND